jgi:hypothetical protein
MELFTVAPEHSRVWIAYPPIPFSHLQYGCEGYRYLFVQQEVWMHVQCISLHHNQFDVHTASCEDVQGVFPHLYSLCRNAVHSGI